MPKIDVRPFKTNTSNVDILNAIRKNASPEYQRRIPEATKAGLQDNLQNLTDYRPGWNEFVEALINRIGLVIVKNNIWTNPLAIFKRGMMQYGDTIEEINVGLIKARTYDPDRQYLERDIFGQYPPEVQSSFHKLNRQNFYPITVNEPLLQRAFLEQFGLQGFISATMSAPTTSDQWDEFLLTCSLIPEYYKAGGFFKVQVADMTNIDSTQPEARSFLRQIRAYTSTLGFMSTLYNAAGMPVAAKPEDLVLITTPEALAAIDVDALSAAFNMDKANIQPRIVVIPKEQFGIPGAQAVLTTEEFFVIADSRIENTSAWNPVSLSTNFFLHHWGVISASRFVPAILFTTEESTPIVIDETPVTGVSAITVVDGDGDTVTDVARGGLYQVVGNAVTTPAGGVNDAVRIELSGNSSMHTYITLTGVLHVGHDEDSTSISIVAYALDADIGEYSNTITVNVVGDKLTLWPNPRVNSDADGDGDFEATPDAIVKDNDTDIVVVPNTEGVQYRKQVSTGVTFTDSGDVVTVPSHGATSGDTVLFGVITSTSGINDNTTYYVKDVLSANTFTIAAVPGGSTIPLTTNGSSASARFDVDAGSEHTIVSSTVFTAVAKSGFELTPGATASWTVTP